MRGDRDISEAAEAKSIAHLLPMLSKPGGIAIGINISVSSSVSQHGMWVTPYLFTNTSYLCLHFGSMQYVRIDGEMCKIFY